MERIFNDYFLLKKIFVNMQIIDIINLYESDIIEKSSILSYISTIKDSTHNVILNNENVSDNFIYNFLDICCININMLIDNRLKFNKNLSCNIIDKYINIYNNIEYINWNNISMLKLTYEFIKKYKNELNWNIICKYKINLNDQIINDNNDFINWYYIKNTF
ncbi:ORF MSV252 tryptophan repeat gene family protein [Melanoplus sanguinipes entomopoxvirus]|uniref:ORF MSV252 tryptophan repeat gene family protein n=1 Tax=Melanoplus sanguinipes entomopoxvirus TaxID=83191 RepID=Q9YVJ0_MSEPV|nr:ORF MSV252 tryptophan repeat gene family protein [Melanoplus sanguinipes entomopoxvirus]AAC97728.1 ORF MSV252 tryptophan repeat gene family protein [Melanoplus sanguinipes entomopoxvirus 'O']